MKKSPASRDSNTAGSLLIYGANGVTGRRMIQLAVDAGLRPIVAGRDPQRLQAIAAPHALEVRAANLSPQALDAIFAGVRVIVSCVGPYTYLGVPVVEAAIRAGAHYIDFTGEPRYVKRLIDDYDAAAGASGSVIVPSAGLGVCSGLAAGLATRGLRSVDRLTVSYRLSGVRMSTGTAQSTLELLAGGAPRVRRGHISFVRSGGRLKRLHGGLAFAFPLTDPLSLSRVWPQAVIQSYVESPAAALVWVLSPLMLAAALPPVRRALRVLEKFTRGAGAAAAAGRVDVTVEAEGDGRIQRTVAEVDNMYELTGRAGFEVAKSLLQRDWPAGVRAASQVLGSPEAVAAAVGIRLRRI